MLMVKYTLFEAYKRKLLLLHSIIVVACGLIGVYARSVSITEGEVSFITFYLGFARVSTVFILGVYLIITESRNWESSKIQNILALPISRYQLLLQKFFGYMLLTFIMVLIVASPLLMVVQLNDLLGWSMAFIFELIVVVMLAMVFSLLFKQMVFSIALLFIFYLFSRVAREFYHHVTFLLSEQANVWELLVAWLIKVSTFLVPHLSQFASTARIIYPGEDHLSLLTILLQTMLYAALLFAIALSTIHRKSF